MRWKMCVSVLAVALCAAAAIAQEEEGMGFVNGSGKESIEVLPDELRMNVALEVKAPTIEEAMTVFKAKREALTKTLTEAGAMPESIKFGDPKCGAAAGSERQQMMRRMMARSRGGASEENAEEETQVISFDAQAAWKLSAASLEDLIPEAVGIQKKVSAISFVDKAAKGEEEEEEIPDEEMYPGENGPSAGKPAFSYARKIDPAKVAEMKKAAYQKAIKDATELAALAEKQLGKLTSINANVDAGSIPEDSEYYARQAYYSSVWRGRFPGAGREDETVAVAPQLGKLKVTVTVGLGFNIK